jgi:hypothetical protein
MLSVVRFRYSSCACFRCRNTKIDEGTIIHTYVPSGSWLWKQWSGTVLEHVWVRVIVMMAISALFSILVHFVAGDDDESPLIEQLKYITEWWEKYVIPSSSFCDYMFLIRSHQLFVALTPFVLQTDTSHFVRVHLLFGGGVQVLARFLLQVVFPRRRLGPCFP